MPACPVIPSIDRFASGLMAFLDCQAQTLGSQGYQALASPASSVSLLLGALLTIFIALVGYRMLLGDAPTLREGVVSIAKIGVVLALSTSWPAYQAIVYDVVLRAPADLAAEIGRPAGLPASEGGLPSRLDGVDHAFLTLATYGVGNPRFAPDQQSAASKLAPPPFPGFDTFALGSSRVVFLGTALGGFALVRIAAGILLALGPLFVLFLLFDATRGLFEGWLRALVGVALGALVTAVLLSVELALLEPWLVDLVNRRAVDVAITGVPAPLFATTGVFALVLIGLLVLAGRIAFSLRLPVARASRILAGAYPEDGAGRGGAASLRSGVPEAESRSRAMVVADSIAAVQRREEQLVEGGARMGGSLRGGGSGGINTGMAANVVVPLGQSARRRTTRRVSTSAEVRDLGA